jgi:hypothetical protein
MRKKKRREARPCRKKKEVHTRTAYLIREMGIDTSGIKALRPLRSNREMKKGSLRNKYSSGQASTAAHKFFARKISFLFLFFSSSCGGAASNLIPTRVAWTSTALVKGAFSDVTRCRLRHRRTELHTGSYFMGLSDFSRMRPFGLGSDISILIRPRMWWAVELPDIL